MKFSNRMQRVQEDIIGKILAIASDPEIISFAGGLPDDKLFPLEEIEKAGLSVKPEDAFQYSLAKGNKDLRISISNMMKSKEVNCSFEDMIITCGSQQGLDLSGKLFLDKDDVVITEAPSYLGAINAFDAYEPKYIEIPMDEEGINPQLVEEALKKGGVKFIYLIPDFQNPTGKTMSIDRRKTLVNLASKYKVPIIEDNPYGELRFEGQPYPAMKSFDKEGMVIYLGTMSKVFCPGLRIGYIIANKDILASYLRLKEASDLQSNGYAQAMTAQYLKNNDIAAHIKNLIKVYSERKKIMLEAIKNNFPEGVTFTDPEGGLFTWVTLPYHIDTEKLFEQAVKKKVAFVPGVFFYPNKSKSNELRLNYSNCDETKIKEGIKRLGDLLKSL